MSERVFRLISGMILWAILIISTLYQDNMLMIAFCIIFLFEGITNWRIPGLISRLRFGHPVDDVSRLLNTTSEKTFFSSIEAERMMRLMVVLFLFISYFSFPDILWFFPWYVAGMMIVAGISNICPMVMFLRWIGFR